MNPIALRLAIFYGAIFVSVGIHLPFWPVWLKSRGLDAAEIGLILSLSTWIRAITNPLTAQIADRRGERKWMIVFLCAGTFLSYALFALSASFWYLLLVALLLGVFYSAFFPLIENLTMIAAERHALHYGRIRMWGSITFIIAAIGGGRLLHGSSETIILWLLLGATLAMTIAALALPDIRVTAAPRREMPILRLLSNRLFVVFILATSLIHASHAAYYGFATLHWRQAGYSDDLIGILWAVGVLAEVVLFAASAAVVRRLGPMRLFTIAAALGAARWAVMGTTTDFAALLVIQTFHAATFGAAHLGAMYFLMRAAPAQFSATAQSLYSGIGSGVALGLMMAVSGWLYDTLEGATFHIMAALCALSALAFWQLGRMWRDDQTGATHRTPRA